MILLMGFSEEEVNKNAFTGVPVYEIPNIARDRP